MTQSTSQVLLEAQDEFIKLLQAKNSWGKNEVVALYQQAQINVLRRYLPG